MGIKVFTPGIQKLGGKGLNASADDAGVYLQVKMKQKGEVADYKDHFNIKT